MEKWNKIADQKNLTEGPTWIDGKGLLYSECSASLTWFWDCNKKTNEVWRNNTGGSNGMILDVKGKLYACEGEGRRVVSYEKDLETELIADSFEGAAFNEPNDLAVHFRVSFLISENSKVTVALSQKCELVVIGF